MKLKSLLKVTTATKIEIIEKRLDGSFVTHFVDYLLDSNNIVNDFEGFIKYPCETLLPEYLLNMKVLHTDIDKAYDALYIRVK